MREIVELNINNKRINIDGICLEKVNNILAFDYENLYYFLETLFTIDNINNRVTIGNRVINNRTAMIVNLIDYESIQQQLSFKKGTLAYEYILQELTENVIDDDNELNNLLDELTKKIVCDSIVDYKLSFNIDISKVLTNYCIIKQEYDLKSYKILLKKLITTYVQNNPRKTVILLINSSIFYNDFDDIDSCILFKINAIENINLFIGKQITNFDQSSIINHITLNWPKAINDNYVRELLFKYIRDYCRPEVNTTEDVEMYIFDYLFSRLMNIKHSLKYIGMKQILDPYKKFIVDLQNKKNYDKI